MSNHYWDLKTRILHLGMAATVSLQLLISLIMEAPDEKDASALALSAFEAHEFVGILAILFIATHWMVSMTDHSKHGLSHLFPWKGEAWDSVKSDLKALRQGRLPEAGPRAGLPGFVHGLGLLVVTGMAVSGGILFFIFPESGEPSAMAEIIAETHESISGLAWAYWIGHVGTALAHHFSGHDTLKKMFSYRKTS